MEELGSTGTGEVICGELGVGAGRREPFCELFALLSSTAPSEGTSVITA